MMLLDLPHDLRALKERAARFVEEEIYPLERTVAERGYIEPEELSLLRAKARTAGFSNLNMPPEYGGADLSMVGQVAVEEEAGKATNGLGLVVADRGPREFLEAANEDQIERYVLPVVQGATREAWAITEPGAGSDLGAITTRAERRGGQWVLDGEKWFVTGAERAGFFIVLAWAEGGQALFIVDRDAPGLKIVRTPRFMHDPYMLTHAELRLESCGVPDENRIIAGNERTKAWFLTERLMIGARCCGAADRLIGLGSEWARERRAFGQPIVDYQAIQFMLADSLAELLAARLLTYHAAAAIDAGVEPSVVHGKVAITKLFASEMAGRVVDRVVQMFGGRGYMTENPAERYYRELRLDRIWEGTSEIQRLIIARGLLRRGAAPYIT